MLIDLGVSRQTHCRDRSAKIGACASGQRVLIDLIGQIVFLEYRQFAGMEHQAGIGRAPVHVLRFGSVGVAVAIATEQRPLGLLLRQKAGVSHPTAAIRHLTVGKTELMHHALAIDEDVVREQRGVLTVRTAAIPVARKTRRRRALD